MKFREEQYQDIVSISQLPQRETEIAMTINYVQDNGFNTEFDEDVIDKALAISNPLTRKWAHEQFVKKEKKYVWNSKKTNVRGERKRLYDSKLAIMDSFVENDEPVHNGNLITESAVKAWGYNPDMFDREEV